MQNMPKMQNIQNTENAKPNLLNQIYHTKLTKPNLQNWMNGFVSINIQYLWPADLQCQEWVSDVKEVPWLDDRLRDFQIVDLEKAVKDRVCSDFGNVSSFTTTVKLLFDMVFGLV